MKSFWTGAVLGVLMGAGAMYATIRGLGVRAQVSSDLVREDNVDAGVDQDPARKKRRAGASAGGSASDVVPVLTDADLRAGAEGDSLRVRERVLDMSSAKDVRDLSQPEIDGTLAQRADDLIGCVVQARGEAPLTGKVMIGLVVSPTGTVSQTRVEAPAYLLRNGLYRCVRAKLLPLHFPSAGKDTVVRVPLDID